MTEAQLIRLMNTLMFSGLACITVALYLIIFKEIHVNMGIKGVQIIAGIIGIGLILLIPSKLYLTLMLMKSSDKKKPLNQEKDSTE